MALADPQTVTINSVAQTLPRTGMTGNAGSFTKADATLRLEVSHAGGSTKRFRTLVKLSDVRTVSNPLVPDQNMAVNMSAHLVVDNPINGYTVTEIAKIAAGLTAWCTEANLTKVLSGES